MPDAARLLPGPLDRMRAQARTLREAAHRPWALPDRPWLMGQTWETLLFAHWRVAPERLAAVVPPQLPLDVRDGAAWVGVTPFVVRSLRLHGIPPVPPSSTFPEVNVRTYVTVGGKPGIFFLSLDAASRLAVLSARRAYRLPYFHARMSVRHEGDEVRYASTRVSRDGEPAALRARYRPAGPVFQAAPGSLEWFLAERYCLYTLDEAQRIHRADIHHPPWPLQPAEASFELNTMASPYGLALEGEPLLHFSGRQDVAIWRRRPLSAEESAD